GAGRPFPQTQGVQRRHRLRRYPQDHEIRAFGKPLRAAGLRLQGRFHLDCDPALGIGHVGQIAAFTGAASLLWLRPAKSRAAVSSWERTERRFRTPRILIEPTPDLRARVPRERKYAWSALMHRLAGIFAAFVILWGAAFSPVSAAASMKNALDDIDAAFTAKTGVKVTASYAASSTLAKQIEQGAPADVFVSADTDWMDYAVSKKSINEPTRVNLLGNSIVLIAPKDSKIGNVTIASGFDLAKLAGDGKIATGDVKSVPVGKYAKAALEKLGAWTAAEPKFAMAESVRAALTLVARGEAVLGIVYSTDAKVEPGVKIVGTFPADSHPPIIYPVAATSTAKHEAKEYLEYLRSSAAKAVLEKYGFNYLLKPTS